jgi:OFA family oxalate/formate antiporter-like MFS transporter
LGVGVLAGTAEGCGYVTPNKNMMLWFPSSTHKGLLTAISIFTFGLGSSICAWMFGIFFPMFGIGGTFLAMAAIYSIPMLMSVALIQKPKYALVKLQKQTKATFSYVQTLKDRYFQKCWLFMFLNISMGLILIGSCASFLSALGFSSGAVITLMMLCGIFNGIGRLVFPAIGDTLKKRSNIWVATAVVEILLMVPVIMAYATGTMAMAAAICIVLIHAGYGSAFACLPGILSTHYGKDTLSQRHGFCLTSWGMASLMAFLCTTYVLKTFSGFVPMMVLVTLGYALNILVSWSISKSR